MTPAQMAYRLPLAVLVFFVVWEACARVDDRVTDGAPLLGRYDQSLLMMSDEFGITGRRGARFAKWSMNAQGFRGPEIDWSRERIVCIGASEAFGLYEPEGQEFPRQLERVLNARAARPRYSVVNAALPGQSLSSFGRRASSLMRQVRPVFAVIYPSLAIYIEPPSQSIRPPSPPVPLRIAPRIYDTLSGAISPDWHARLQRLAMPAPRMTAVPERSIARFRADLRRLLDILSAAHVRAILVTHATRFGSSVNPQDKPVLTAWRTLYPILAEDAFLPMEERLNDVIRQEAGSRGLPLEDAARWLHGRANFVEYVHFTPEGAGALAEAVAAHIP